MDRRRDRRRPELSGRGQVRESGKPVDACRMCMLTGNKAVLSEEEAYSVSVPRQERGKEEVPPQTRATFEDRARYILFLLRIANDERATPVLCRKHAEECAEVVATVAPEAVVELWSKIRRERIGTQARRSWRDDEDEDVPMRLRECDRNRRKRRDADALPHIALSCIAALDQGLVRVMRERYEAAERERELARERAEEERKARETFLERLVKGDLEAREAYALDFAKSEPKQVFACAVPDCRTRGNAYARSQKDKPLLWAREVHPRDAEKTVRIAICGWHLFQASELAKKFERREIRSPSLLDAFEHARHLRQMLEKLGAVQESSSAPPESACGNVVSRRSPEWWQKRNPSQRRHSEGKQEDASALLTLKPGETVMGARLRLALGGDKTPK